MSMHLKKIEDTDSHILWISDSVNYGDFPLRYFLKLEYMDYFMGEKEVKEYGKYYIQLGAVSIDALSVNSLLGVSGQFEGNDFVNFPVTTQHAECIQYGCYAPLFQKSGNNKAELLKHARREFKQVQFLFGFYMDKQVNGMGATGWDAIKGELIPQRGNV